MNINKDLEDILVKHSEECSSDKCKEILTILLKEIERLRLELLRLKGY